MEIRTAGLADLEAIVAIYNQAVAEQATADVVPRTVAGHREWLIGHAPDRRPVRVAEDGHVVVGWLSLSDYRPGRGAVRHTAEVSYYVDRAHRRQGVASALLRDCIEICPGLGIKTLFGILLDDNRGSVELLERLGFERWGRLPAVADFDGREVGHLYYGLRLDS